MEIWSNVENGMEILIIMQLKMLLKEQEIGRKSLHNSDTAL